MWYCCIWSLLVGIIGLSNEIIMKILIFIIIWFWLFITQTSFACMPFFPTLIIVWTFEWVESGTYPEWEKLTFVNISDIKRPFASDYFKNWKYYSLGTNETNFDLSNYKKWDLIIGIADSENWNYEEYFTIFDIWKLIIGKDWKLNIVDTQWYHKDENWWKPIWWCWNYKSEWVMDKEELLYKISNYLNIWSQRYIENNYMILSTTIINSIFIVNNVDIK